MRRLELSDYTVTLRNEAGELEDLTYPVKDSLVELLLARSLQIAGRELIIRDDIARKILAADGVILLEEEEYQRLVTSAEVVTGQGRTDVGLIRRIFDAPEVEVEEKKPAAEASEAGTTEPTAQAEEPSAEDQGTKDEVEESK